MMGIKDMNYVTVEQVLALRDAAIRSEEQRDQLAEALYSIVECWDGPLYKHEMLPLIRQARAALNQLEGE